MIQPRKQRKHAYRAAATDDGGHGYYGGTTC